MTMPVDVKLLRFDTVRCALAIAAFGVIGGLAWLRGDGEAVAANATDHPAMIGDGRGAPSGEPAVH